VYSSQDFLQGYGAGFAGWAGEDGILPAAVTLGAFGALYCHFQFVAGFEDYLRGDEQGGEVGGVVV
jgi:hypothetical protein